VEALESRERLASAVEQILQRDEEFATRVQNLDGTSTADDTSQRFYDNESTVTSPGLSTTTAARPDADSVSGSSSTAKIRVVVEVTGLAGRSPRI
jgi:carbohydrate-binding DOMON domain-containing protein